MASVVIGVVGKKRAGKDTFAARLVERGFTRVAFADPLKETMADLDPWVRIEADEAGLLYGPGTVLAHNGPEFVRLTAILKAVGWDVAKQFREVRRLLQAHGVAIREHVDPDVWIYVAKDRIDAIPGPVVITDVRFRNEADAVEEWGGNTVRVLRPGLESTDAHVSETELDDYVSHFDIVNDGTVSDLRAKADDLLRNPEIAWPLAAYR